MQVYCILGDERVMRSKSPTIFSAVLKRIGLKGSYVPFKVDPDQIGSALQSIRVLNIAGASITIPFKEKVIPHLDVLSEGANIIDAINYTQEGGKIIIAVDMAGINIRVRVKDNGFGIADKYLDKIFERFYRVKDDKTRYITGTGLGLPIVKGLLDSTGGLIDVESEPGKGSLFTVLIPVKT